MSNRNKTVMVVNWSRNEAELRPGSEWGQHENSFDHDERWDAWLVDTKDVPHVADHNGLSCFRQHPTYE